ncbi:hypothetical protein ASPBRDRAFT_568371 [Aspergillus brasiliensis CBS 101740]|uniref:Uncharacterized protein n=1 Tax=Aspergillus brasiliensis (strain CBS 101740 / IMI 381727 / IBT 21946) TaxID=767769 RepID=A0A1L9UIP5_ASPBC|nr:hypothetical protein ASPBRDRAFT_568371 [Aspergillus brasiliensis CBS 101740]
MFPFSHSPGLGIFPSTLLLFPIQLGLFAYCFAAAAAAAALRLACLVRERCGSSSPSRFRTRSVFSRRDSSPLAI